MPRMTSLKQDRFTITSETRGTSLTSTAKRYTRASGSGPSAQEPAAILLMSHGAGFFKEIWEPVIEDLIGLDDSVLMAPTKGLRVREIWVLDWQNHGEAAVINAGKLVKDPAILDYHEYAKAFVALYESGFLGALNSELDKIIPVGHSAGAVIATLATSYFNQPQKIPFTDLILIDPPISPVFVQEQTEAYKAIDARTPHRKDVWSSRAAAIEWMQKRPLYASWDRRIFDVYIDRIIDPNEGRNFASVTRIAGAGHLVVQEAPSKVAQAIFAILRKNPPVEKASRL
ncbi:hypothetical protein H0H92_014887 [Tricholoma furcatifolium]|nr:hypothetical protein H0H92_014887 [Tricholoma furcatifolium]